MDGGVHFYITWLYTLIATCVDKLETEGEYSRAPPFSQYVAGFTAIVGKWREHLTVAAFRLAPPPHWHCCSPGRCACGDLGVVPERRDTSGGTPGGAQGEAEPSTRVVVAGSRRAKTRDTGADTVAPNGLARETRRRRRRKRAARPLRDSVRSRRLPVFHEFRASDLPTPGTALDGEGARPLHKHRAGGASPAEFCAPSGLLSSTPYLVLEHLSTG